jgi:3-deoxy-manno-octulosonate cytidylyltransferase (CMP-KDO synthetase)
MSNLAIVIPSRLESTRLPNKPLIKFNGIPMIIHVALTCMETIAPHNVFVSSPNREILDLCSKFEINTHQSSFEAKSGTDRIVEFIKTNNFTRIINVQGDELLLNKNCLKNFIKNTKEKTNATIGIAAISNLSEVKSASVVKISHSNGKLIYASRSEIPSSCYSQKHKFFKQTGLYMYTRESLVQFSSAVQGELEKIEKVEILRLIENRFPVDVVKVAGYQYTIDTSKNVKDARTLINKGFSLGGYKVK